MDFFDEEVTLAAFEANLSLLLAWSDAEGADYLEQLHRFKDKTADQLMERVREARTLQLETLHRFKDKPAHQLMERIREVQTASPALKKLNGFGFLSMTRSLATGVVAGTIGIMSQAKQHGISRKSQRPRSRRGMN